MELMRDFLIKVKKLKGRNEFEIYKNFINDLPRERLDFCISTLCNEEELKSKDNLKATLLRNEADKFLARDDVPEDLCLRLYTKSLCYSVYDSREYAMALAARSKIFFNLEDYKSCITDIESCLKSLCPKTLRLMVLIRKAKCYQKLGNADEISQTLTRALRILEFFPDSIKDKYKPIINKLSTIPAEKTQPIDDKDNLPEVPKIEENEDFTNASSSVDCSYTKWSACRVFAKKDIKRGEVLFVEKAFAFAPIKTFANFEEPFSLTGPCILPVRICKSCQYCLALLTSCIPCKLCVKHLYCNEECRDSAWTEFHRWECYAVRAKMVYASNHGYLALRIIFKGLSTGLPLTKVDFGEICQYGSKYNNYPFVYSLPRKFDTIGEEWLNIYAATAAVWVYYLKKKTDFFEVMKRSLHHNYKTSRELIVVIGGLIIRHCIQLHTNIIPVRIIDNVRFSFKYITTAITVCPSAAVMRHSCLPNTSHYFVNDTLVVKATEDIKADEEVFRSFTTAVSSSASLELIHAGNEKRRNLLSKWCFINCTCRACCNRSLSKDALDAYLCIKCQGPAVITNSTFAFSVKTYTCLKCWYKFTFPRELLASVYLQEHFQNSFTCFDDIEDANKSLDIIKTFCVSTHYLFVECYTMLYNYHLSRGNVKGLLETTKSLVMFGKRRRCNITVEPALFMLSSSSTAIEILKDSAIDINLQDLGLCLHILTEFLEEVKDVFTFYYPHLIKTPKTNLEAVYNLRILHTLRIANSAGAL